MRVSRVAGLLSRLVPQEVNDPRVFEIFVGFLEALKTKDGPVHDAIECLAVLHLLSVLGLDRGDVPSLAYSEQMLETISRDRQTYVLRINHGITASGL
jgi:hypothetical protein